MGMESSKDSRIKTIKIQDNSTIFEFSFNYKTIQILGQLLR